MTNYLRERLKFGQFYVATQINDASIMRRSLSLMHPFSVTSANIAVSHILLKQDSLDHMYVGVRRVLSSTTLTQWALSAADFGEITQNMTAN